MKKKETIRHGVGNIYYINSKGDSSDGIICMLVSNGVCSNDVFFITLLDGTPVECSDMESVEDIHNLTEREWKQLTEYPKLFSYIPKNLISLNIKGMDIIVDEYKRYKIQKEKTS